MSPVFWVVAALVFWITAVVAALLLLAVATRGGRDTRCPHDHHDRDHDERPTDVIPVIPTQPYRVYVPQHWSGVN